MNPQAHEAKVFFRRERHFVTGREISQLNDRLNQAVDILKISLRRTGLDQIYNPEMVDRFVDHSIFASTDNYSLIQSAFFSQSPDNNKMKDAFLIVGDLRKSNACVIHLLNQDARQFAFRFLKEQDKELQLSENTDRLAFFKLSDMYEDFPNKLVKHMAHELYHFYSRVVRLPDKQFRNNKDRLDTVAIATYGRQILSAFSIGMAHNFRLPSDETIVTGYEFNDAFAEYQTAIVDADLEGISFEANISRSLMEVILTRAVGAGVDSYTIMSAFLFYLFGDDAISMISKAMRSDRNEIYKYRSRIPGVSMEDAAVLLAELKEEEIYAILKKHAIRIYRH